MHTLRRTRWLTCLLLVWFSAVVGVATASPFWSPQTLRLVCSNAGEVKLVLGSDDGAPLHRQGLECPLCLPTMVGAPGNAAGLVAQLPRRMAQTQALPQPAHRPWRTAAPLPARGPPRWL